MVKEAFFRPSEPPYPCCPLPEAYGLRLPACRPSGPDNAPERSAIENAFALGDAEEA